MIPGSGQSARRAPSFGLASQASSKLRRMRGSSNALPPVPPKSATASASASAVSIASSPMSPHASTFQDRLIEALVKRVKQSLPFFSGQDLTAIEVDESVKQTVETLVEMARAGVSMIVRQLVDILSMLDKQRENNLEHKLLVQVLQSQLLIIKILDLCVTFHWHCHRDKCLGIGYPANGSATSLSSNAPYAQGNHPSTIAHTSGTPWVDPPVLDGSLAKATLELVSGVLRRCAAQGGGELSFHDFEAIEAVATITPGDSPNSSTTSLPQKTPTGATSNKSPPPSTTGGTNNGSGGSAHGSSSGSSRSKAPQDPYAVHHKPFALRPTFITMAQEPAALHTQIAKFAGRIVFFLSASNWSTVYSAFRQQLFSLSSQYTEESANLTDLRLIANSALDRKKLVQVLSDVGSLLYNFKRESQLRMAASIGTAIWNWIDIFPDEYREASQSSRALSGAPERVFDAYYQILDEHNRPQLWPALSALLSISPERIRQAEGSRGGFTSLFNRSSSRKPQHFLENVARGLMHTRTLEASITSYNALCRAAIHIPPNAGNIAIRALAPDLAEAIRNRIMTPNPPLKGFHETTEPIDLKVMSEAMVTIYRFNPHMALETVFLPCLAANRSDGVKCCVVRALITLATEAPRMQWQAPLNALYPEITPLLRDLFGALSCRKKEIDASGRSVFKSQLPRIKQDGQTSDRDLLMLAIMSLWRIELGFFYYGITEDQTRVFVREAGQILLRKESTMLRMSGARTFGGLFMFALSFQPGDECYEGGVYYLTAGMPITLSFASDMFMKNPDVMALQGLAVQQMSAVLPTYANPMVEDIGGWKSSPVRMPSFAAGEICLLVALTSHSMDQTVLAASNLRALAAAEILTSDSLAPPAYLSAEEVNLRWYAYKQLADPDAPITGRLANQKRMRRLLQNVAFVNGINIMAWEECYRRWFSLLHYIRSAKEYAKRSIPETDGRTIDDILADWQHLCLFLASFGGCCMTDLTASEVEIPKLPPDFLMGRHHLGHAPKEMMRQFIGTVRELLVSDNPMVRETAREAFGSELHPACFILLLPQIEKSIGTTLQPSGKLEWDPARVLFVDQLLSMFKSLVERTDQPQHATNVDGSAVMLLFVSFLARADTSEAAFRLKTKFCALVEVVFSKRDMFPIRQENQLRKDLLDKIFDWIAAAQAMSGESPLARLYIDCEIAGLRAASRLLENQSLSSLEGKPSIGHNADSDNIASMLFYRYFTTFMVALGQDEPQIDGRSSHSVTSSLRGKRTSSDTATIKKLVIEGLVNMLVANNTVGPKYCLTLGFHEDVTRRTVFAEVFSRLVRQGTKFDTSKPAEKSTPRMLLCDHVKTSTPLLALAICQVCPESEAESMVSVLLRIFSTRKAAMSLLKSVIDQELQSNSNSMGHFRNNSMRVRLLSTFAKLQSEEFLRRLINPVIEQMASVPDAQYETDPLKAGNYILDDNVSNLEVITQMFLDNLFNAVDLIPSVIRELCSHIYRSMADESPELQILPVISFIFLRVISPGLAVPESIGVDLPSDNQAIQRGLILIAKTIQQLANNTRLNSGIKSPTENINVNVMAMMQFCQSLVADTTSSVELDDPVIAIPYDESDGIMLHRFLHMHSDKVSRELMALPAFSPLDEDKARRTIAWDAVSALLLEIGIPMEIPRLMPQSQREHNAYREFMQRNTNRNVDSVKDIFVKISSTKGGKAVFGLFMSRINVETDDIELLITHIFKCLKSVNLHGSRFDIIVDCSGFNAASDIPLSWWLNCLALIPEDFLARLTGVYIVNANIAAQRFLRKLYYVCWGLESPTTIVAVTSWLDLREQMPTLDIENISKTSSMDTELRDTFDGLEFHQVPEPPLRVTFELAASHIRIVSKRPQQIWPGLNCKFTEIITLEEVGELLSISASGEDEFVIRPQHGRPSFLTSKTMPTIVNAVRAATGRLKQYQPALSKEVVRVEATTATLINVALVNMSHRHDELRLAMLNLLHDVANFLGLRDMPLLPPAGSFVPSNPFAIANDFSKRLANHFPDLTLEFLQEFSTSLGKYELEQRPTAVQHVAAWVRNLALFCNPASPHYDATGSKLRETLRMLLEMTVKHEEVYGIIQRHVWVEISRLETETINYVLDELIFAATTSGIGTRSCEVVADTLVSLASIHVRGKLLARLRKAFTKESVLNSKQLSDDGAWHQLAALTRLALVACHHGRFPYQIQLFVPELVHAMTLIVCHGPIMLRTSLHSMACNMIQALYLARCDDPEASRTLTGLLDEFLTDEVTLLFGIQRPGPGEDFEPVRISSEAHIASVEGLTVLFQRVMIAAAASETLANVWRARWMSLISSCAMFMWPAIQSRAFLAFACLATSDVDDGFVEQMLGCLRDTLSAGKNIDMAQACVLLRALSTVVPILRHDSIYLPQMFWLAAGIIASTSNVLYPEASKLMAAVVMELEEQGIFEDHGMAYVLIEAREPLMESITHMEDMLTLSFESAFAFSIASIVFRGVRHGSLRSSAEMLLRTLLQVNARTMRYMRNNPDGMHRPIDDNSLPFFLALTSYSTTQESFARLLDDADAAPGWTETARLRSKDSLPVVSVDMLGVSDLRTAVLAAAFLVSTLPNANGDAKERDIMYKLLSDTGSHYPQIVALACKHTLNSMGSIDDSITSVFASSSSQSMASALTLLRLSMFDFGGINSPPGSGALGSPYAPSMVDSLGDSISLHSTTEMGTLLETYSMDGMLGITSTLLVESPIFSEKMLLLVADMVTTMLKPD
ncbi:hypothetical protein EXIGLDRAFT_778147 [Exidia glandulosa HHB12029]|uniref:Ras-GAP domain-containing protein n=1 Tax=Exidia glandulosa HHB12029 TaxID=1314781 RepID=A0A165CPI1_EXIGL|nr:hypothetical protein EXIGLDRAFT_778147 [Exidia glandulosa HHB12029]